MTMCPSALTSEDRQAKPEGSPGAGVAFHADPAVVTLDDRAADEEAEAQAEAGAALNRDAIGAVEAIPDLVLLLRTQARSLVAHVDAYPAVVRRYSDVDHLLRSRELQRVCQVIHQYLPDT